MGASLAEELTSRRRCTRAAVAAVALATSCLGGVAQGAVDDELIGLVNAYRTAPRTCEGERSAMAGALAPSAVLAGAPVTSAGDLRGGLSQAGYQAAVATVIAVSGPLSARRAMALIEQRYCRVLLDRRFTEIGVAHADDSWRVILAQPLLPADLGNWRMAGERVLELVNTARRTPRTCGERRFAATGALVWNDALASAALEHSRDMARSDYFDHAAPNGEKAAQRAARAGYPWRVIGENIAAGQGRPEQVVAGWLASPGHCANIMNADFADMGVAYATDPASEMVIYWTQVFGRR